MGKRWFGVGITLCFACVFEEDDGAGGMHPSRRPHHIHTKKNIPYTVSCLLRGTCDTGVCAPLNTQTRRIMYQGVVCVCGAYVYYGWCVSFSTQYCASNKQTSLYFSHIHIHTCTHNNNNIPTPTTKILAHFRDRLVVGEEVKGVTDDHQQHTCSVVGVVDPPTPATGGDAGMLCYWCGGYADCCCMWW